MIDTHGVDDVIKQDFLYNCEKFFNLVIRQHTPQHAMISNDSSLLSQRDCVTKPRVVAACRYPGKLAPTHLTNPNGVASAASA